MSECENYFGLYRGTVMKNIDPEKRGRLLVTVPDVLKLLPSTWAEPSVPLAGPTGAPMGMYAVPPIGAGVWVQFEHGNPGYPIWTGCRWGPPADVPMMAQSGNPASPPLVIQSMGQHMVMISDVPPTPATGGIILRSASGASIVVNDAGIFLSNGTASIHLVGNTVSINGTALIVTT